MPLIEKSKSRAVIYSRVSTDKQETLNQTAVLTEWAQRRNMELCGIYQENESAWKAGHQKELARLFDDARRHKFDVVLVWALDRVSREGVLAILQKVDLLHKYSVKLWSYQESWTEAPGELSEILYALTGWVARFESQRRSERTRAGMATAKAKGKRLGRPPGSKDKKKRRGRRYAL